MKNKLKGFGIDRGLLDAPPRHMVLRPIETIITPRRDRQYLGALSKRASPEYTSEFVRLKQIDRWSSVVK
jgi:hypothetical protein